jgi:hydrogenase maturation protein HypF
VIGRLDVKLSELRGARVHVTGVVQGVGFRPFVYGLAGRLGLAGWVCNTSAGVDIEVDGNLDALEAFKRALEQEAPPLARIDRIDFKVKQPGGFTVFEIVDSQAVPGGFQPVSPDVSICPDCLSELFDPNDRRYRYPFINCTNCGPRFTIIEAMPYDRPNTTMAPFEMCPDCAAEYQDPSDRRYHAQPVACPVCGPQIWLECDGQRLAEREDALQDVRAMLRQGKIVAIKGIGGFHLACDASNAAAVDELRRRKLRVDKPFALMAADTAIVEQHCIIDDESRELLESRERPIAILPRREGSTIALGVAPGQRTLGMMLPYTPLHALLLEPGDNMPRVLVMTSGNLSEEPIATRNDQARRSLANLADAFLMHDREIRTRCDDSVYRSFRGASYPARRARGFAPFPVRLPCETFPILAVGGELKNTFCSTRGEYAFVSQHIGDMENYETLQSFEEATAHFENLFRIRPQAIAYDMHPDYMATRYALKRAQTEGLPAVGVQHHHGHITACMAEHRLSGERSVIGVAFDGTGYGEDGAIWGGEFLLADYQGYRRLYHLAYVPLVGGEAAVRQPWRVALAWLRQSGQAWDDDLPPVGAAAEEARETVLRQIVLGLNSPMTSSMGRLFDAVSSLAGVRQSVNYEAQAAIELEACIDPDERGKYAVDVSDHIIDPTPMIGGIVADMRHGISKEAISARFHNTMTEMVLDVCLRIRRDYRLSEVALSGGVWQNMAMLERTVRLLEGSGFTVYIHRQVPTNDGGLALGQAVVGICRLGGRLSSSAVGRPSSIPH